jgi:hypothetical protein
MKKQILAVLSCGAALFAVSAPLQAAVLTSVPMQGGMVMPMITYKASMSKLMVMMPGTVPALTPLLVSNPGDSFDPADPWFNNLDPSRQGLAFSRRYGFMWDANMTDPLPAETEVWIRKLSGSAGLGFYRYAANPPKQWTPVFGTDGTTNALVWDRVMFHPGVSALPGTNTFSATFQVFLVSTTTGQEVAGSASMPFVFNFTDLPDGRPALTIATKVVVSWPSATSANWLLESASTLPATDWTLVPNAPVVVDGEPSVVLPVSATAQFYRMRYVP